MVLTFISARSGQALMPSLWDAPLTLKLITLKKRPSTTPPLRRRGPVPQTAPPRSPVRPGTRREGAATLPERRPSYLSSAQETVRRGKSPRDDEREERSFEDSGAHERGRGPRHDGRPAGGGAGGGIGGARARARPAR